MAPRPVPKPQPQPIFHPPFSGGISVGPLRMGDGTDMDKHPSLPMQVMMAGVKPKPAHVGRKA